ncbi:MAG TPA: 1-acyl-sn-glycerol-3-phosphate acyltransferase, partial [Nitrospirota bacterium]
KPGSIGIPVPDVEVRIANPDAQGMGEIAVRGPNVMLGYYRKPQETAEVLRDGWFHTGDLGYRDPEGYFFITGRSKEMIVLSTGKKIFPEELEKFYKQIPSIKEICLIQGDRGIEAAVVPDFEYLKKMGLSNSRETIALKLEDLAKGLPPYKRITGLKIFKDPLPVTRLGKLKRSQVRDLYQKAGAAAEKTGQQADADLLADPVGKKLLSCLEPFSAKKAIGPDDNLELDLGLDSLARVEVVVSIEKTFGLSLPDSFGSEVFTVRDAVIRIRELLSAGPMKTGERVRLSWAEILESGPAEDARKTVELESGLVNKAVRAVIRILLILIMKTCGRLKAKGLENLPSTGPYIIAPNHLSIADVPSLAAAMSWKAASRVFFLGATEYFGGPVMSGISRFFQVIPVDMDTKLFGALQLSAYVLRHGKILCVFPEGTRSRDGRIKEFKKGVGILARELNVPLVPVAIRGTYEMLPTGSLVPRLSKVSLSFGKPVYPGQKEYDEIVREVNQEVVNMLEESK